MTQSQIKALLKDKFKEAFEYISIEYENERHNSECKIPEIKVSRLKLNVSLSRDDMESRDNMESRLLIAPKRLKRLRVNIKVSGIGEYKVELTQPEKDILKSNRSWEEIPALSLIVIKVARKLLEELLERKFELTDGEVKI
jgi:hypothetical protein